jgi:hypothetical protein
MCPHFHVRHLAEIVGVKLYPTNPNASRQVDKRVQPSISLVAMNLPGLEFGLFIIGCGVLTLFRASGKKDDDTVFVGRLGIAPTSAKAVRIWGKILVLGGAFLFTVSLL